MNHSNGRRRWLRIAIIVAVLIAILLLLYCCVRRETHVAVHHPHLKGPTLTLGDAVVTGFSGVRAPDRKQPLPAGKRAVDQTFIDLGGASARVFDVTKPGFAWDARFWSAPRKRDIPASAIGQVFGVAIDGRSYPNVYFTATSVYGLNLVAPDRDKDRIPERTTNGGEGVSWMAGQFGSAGGPGSIWKIDGRTGAISKFADITHDGVANHGPALGNITSDRNRSQLFVSDFATGMIHRFDLKGKDLSTFDHGRSGRPVEGLDPVFHREAGRVSIQSKSFDALKPGTWGFTPEARRVWALAVHDGRLYYSVWKPSQIWSVGLRRDGNFAGDPRWEADLPGGEKALPVSDIVFTSSGRMIVAQRAGIASSYDYSSFAQRGAARVYRFSLESPDSPATKSRWTLEPEEYAVGFAGEHRNANGGVDLGYAYDKDGKVDFSRCEETLWATGENLRGYKAIGEGRFEPDGPLLVQGLQAAPSGPVREFNTPPVVAYLTDYDDKLSDEAVAGHVGSVRIYRVPCGGGACFAPSNAPRGVLAPGGAFPPMGGGGGTTTSGPTTTTTTTTTTGGGGGGCVGPDCLSDEECEGPDCEPGRRQLCMKVDGEFECDEEAGGWVYKITSVQDRHNLAIDIIKAYSQTPGVSVANGPHINVNPLPGIVQLSGTSPGQVVNLDLCGHNQAASATGEPYDCCRITLRVRAPTEACPAR